MKITHHITDEMYEQQMLHDFRCAALGGFCSLKDSYGDPRDAKDLANWAEDTAQAMLKIARGDK